MHGQQRQHHRNVSTVVISKGYMTAYVPPSISVLGIPVTNFRSSDEAVRTIEERIDSGERTFCVAINPEKIYRMGHDARLKRAVNSAQVRICDGVGVSIASWLLYGRRLARCTGIDLFLKLVDRAAGRGWKVFLLGASPEVNEAACRELVKTFPALTIVGSQNGFFENPLQVVKNINDSGAEVLFVAMGSPRQEFWISEHWPDLNTTFCMGVGGSLDVVSGLVKRAPASFRKTGTEWLYRLLADPRRFRRQLALPSFAWDTLRAMARRWVV
jgi:N-acetylglucosaminyldiphosphoundecaprenol N-acetyl-beta-D-mannosaminyltransferase